jgi:hypothetical protein
MIEFQFVEIVFIILTTVLIIKLLGKINIARIVAVHSQQKQNVFPAHVLRINGKLLYHEAMKTSLMNKQIKFRKIPLKVLIETLIHIHNTGADYVDIIGVQDDVQDVVTIAVEDEYMSDDNDNDKLDDEDINDLMI